MKSYKELVLNKEILRAEVYVKVDKKLKFLEEKDVKIKDREWIIHFFMDHFELLDSFSKLVNKLIQEFSKGEYIVSCWYSDTFFPNYEKSYILITVRAEKPDDERLYRLDDFEYEFRDQLDRIFLVSDFKKIGEEITPGGCDG